MHWSYFSLDIDVMLSLTFGHSLNLYHFLNISIHYLVLSVLKVQAFFSPAFLLAGLLLMVDAIFFSQFCFTINFADMRTVIVDVSITFYKYETCYGLGTAGTNVLKLNSVTVY